MSRDKIHCLIWPELNDYTGKSNTIGCFTSEGDMDIDDFVLKISSFWNDLSNWILQTNKSASNNLGQNLKFWFSMIKKDLTESEIEKFIKSENDKYFVKNYIIKQNDLSNFNWKKFQEFSKKELSSVLKVGEKEINESISCLSSSFYGPICDTFRQDETNNVSIIKILPSTQMISNFFNNAIKFINSSVVVDKFTAKSIENASTILEHYLNIPDIVEIK